MPYTGVIHQMMILITYSISGSLNSPNAFHIYIVGLHFLFVWDILRVPDSERWYGDVTKSGCIFTQLVAIYMYVALSLPYSSRRGWN